MTRNKRVKIFKEKKSPLSLQESLKKDELYCNVCRDFPKSKEIFQCKNSHLLCSFCHSRILEKDPSTCPVCRIKLSRENPCRSRLAESIISKMVVHCPNTLCAEKLYNEDLRRHERELCPFRNARCKFFSIGCEWRGIAKKKRKHEKSCAIRSLSADNILKFCRERSAIREAAERKRIAVLEKERRLVAALSQRSRCVVVRELKMYSSGNRRVSGKLCKVFVSRRFNVFECVFYLEVVVAVGDNLNEQVVVTPTVVTNASSNVPGNNNISSVVGNNGVANNNNISSVAVGDNKNMTLIAATNNIETKAKEKMSRETANIVKTRLFCVKHEKKPRIEAFVLPGPGPQSFCPVFLKLKERNGEYKSEEAPVDLTGAQAQEAFPGVLRVVMMDKASGVEPRFVVNDDFCYEGDSNFYSEDYDLYEDYESEGGGDSECEGDQYESFDYREQ